jgi:hypothetical protein
MLTEGTGYNIWPMVPERIGYTVATGIDNVARYIRYNVPGRYWIQSFQSILETKLPEDIGYTPFRDYWIQDTVWPECNEYRAARGSRIKCCQSVLNKMLERVAVARCYWTQCCRRALDAV